MDGKQPVEMNGDTLLFAVFCIEGLAARLNMDGAAVFKLLTGKGDILDTYILKHYDTLHTQGKDYIVGELTELMKHEGLIQ